MVVGSRLGFTAVHYMKLYWTLGKSDPYCEVYVGSQEHRTLVVPSSLNPKWNASMQFLIKDLKQDVLCLTVLNRDSFSPNEFLGRTEVRLCDIVEDSKTYRGPLIKRMPLLEVESGEIVFKLDLQLFDQNWHALFDAKLIQIVFGD